MIEYKMIQTALEAAAADLEKLPYTDDKWTRFIMTLLCKVGQDEKYYVCTSKADQADRSEWLFDLTWIKYDETQPIKLGLVLECEWGVGREEADKKFDKIEYDFQKLILARADLRCMIFWADDEAQARKDILRLLNQVQRFQMSEPGDNYLFCVVLGEERHFGFFHHYTHL